MKFAVDFESFLRVAVNLNPNRLARLQEHVDAVEGFIASDSTFGEMFLDIIPAGSWAHGSIIKPVRDNDTFDADVLLQLTEKPDWNACDYINVLYKSFRSSGKYKNIVRRKKRCVRIDYAGEFHIDLVPYLERGGLNYITNREKPEETGRFELSNPEAFTEWIHERQQATGGRFIKIVRLLKYLRDFKDNFSCKSIILTTLLGQQVNVMQATADPDLYADTPSTLVALLESLARMLPDSMPAVFDPGGTGDNFSERYKDEWNYENFRKWIRYYAAKARAAFDETDRGKSIRLWRELLGDKFKPGELPTKATLAPLSASLAVAGEQFIHKAPYDFPIGLVPDYAASIAARCSGLSLNGTLRRNGFRVFNLPSYGNRVPKNRELFFSLSTNVPEPFDVYWKVRNGGSEAAQARQFRGEIRIDEGKLQRSETTKYAGAHYVEAYVVKSGRVVAVAHQPVIVTS